MNAGETIRDLLFFERKAISDGFNIIAGIDEAGRGALCGPVVAASVIFPHELIIPGVKDSKLLTSKQRNSLFFRVSEQAMAIGIGIAHPIEIDQINILQATKLAMKRAIERLGIVPELLLIDAVHLENFPTPQQSIIRGDQLSHSIASASIVAKVIRDRIMDIWSNRFPEYGLNKHKGYGTVYHLQALQRFGPCPLHRKTFKGVRDCRELFTDRL